MLRTTVCDDFTIDLNKKNSIVDISNNSSIFPPVEDLAKSSLKEKSYAREKTYFENARYLI